MVFKEARACSFDGLYVTYMEFYWMPKLLKICLQIEHILVSPKIRTGACHTLLSHPHDRACYDFDAGFPFSFVLQLGSELFFLLVAKIMKLDPWKWDNGDASWEGVSRKFVERYMSSFICVWSKGATFTSHKRLWAHFTKEAIKVDSHIFFLQVWEKKKKKKIWTVILCKVQHGIVQISILSCTLVQWEILLFKIADIIIAHWVGKRVPYV